MRGARPGAPPHSPSVTTTTCLSVMQMRREKDWRGGVGGVGASAEEEEESLRTRVCRQTLDRRLTRSTVRWRASLFPPLLSSLVTRQSVSQSSPTNTGAPAGVGASAEVRREHEVWTGVDWYDCARTREVGASITRLRASLVSDSLFPLEALPSITRFKRESESLASHSLFPTELRE